MTAPAGLRRSEAAGLAVGLAISALALGLALSWSGWKPLTAAFAGADLNLLLPAGLIHLVSLGARAASWNVILDRRAGFRRTFATLCEGYLMNNILPGRVGELGRSFLLGRRPGLTPAMVLASIVIERMYDLGLALVVLTALWPLVVDAPWAVRAATFAAILLAAGAVFAVIALRSPARVDAWLSRLPGGGVRWRSIWQNVQSGLRTLSRPRPFAVSLLWMAFGWGLAGIEYWLVLTAFVPGAPLAWAFLALAVSALSAGVPSAPGSVGIFEAAAVAALAAVAVPASSALAFALTAHGVTLVLTSILGAIALAGEGETLLGVWRAARARLRSA
ncbi:MAG: lysylphosphatidylglycerol synthase transmembrane domain-containing protein [Anaerolineales bacterium]